MINSIILVGRLTRDPELRYTPNGKAVANFTLAVDRPFMGQGGEKQTDFIRVTTWRKLAENCSNYIGKGSLVALKGRLEVRSWENDEGQRRTMAEVVADTVQFLDKKGKKEEQQGIDDLLNGQEITDEDIPF